MIAPASRKIGKYEIRQKLGRGGMADVYLAEDTVQGGLVALKLIEHSQDADTCDSIEAERRGAQLQARLAEIDPRVVRIYDSGDLDGYFFVAMEYVDGQDLAEWMRHGRLEPEFAADTAIAVARTLQNAHALAVNLNGKDHLGMVHGDIKPKNIRINARGEVRVLDFGIAKALSLSRKLTRNDFGSVPYASPERLDSGDVSAASDLWSLGIMLYEMAAGVQPYHAESTGKLEHLIRSRAAVLPAPDPCPEPLRRIIMKAIAPDPEMRYQTADELASDLEAFRAGKPVRAMAEDMDATRRTSRPAEAAGDETRRTVRSLIPEPASAAPLAAAASEQWPRPRPARPVTNAQIYRRRAAAALAVLVVILTCWMLFSDYLVYAHGQELEHAVQAEQLTDPDQIWQQWTNLAGDRPSSWLLRGPRKAIKTRFLAAVDRTIEAYRNSDAVSEAQWKSTRDLASRALALEPDEATRGKLRLAEGHLARISAAAHRSGADYLQAIEKYNEAQALLPASPDPQLGLARVYVYGLKEIDKAYQALHEAEVRGYQLGNREKLQLADGYLDRADRMYWASRSVRGLQQEKDQVLRSRDDYQRALELYQGIAPYGKSGAAIPRVQKSLESVNFRLQEIEHPPESGNGSGIGSTIGKMVDRLLHKWP